MNLVKNFSFFVPTRIEYGRNCAKKLIEEIKTFNAKKPLVVTDKGVQKLNFFNSMLNELEDNGYKATVYDDILANPRDVNCNEGARVAIDKEADIIVAIGGGSPIDSAKVISMLATNPGTVQDYYGYNKPYNKGLPLITIPTTAGTGSEVTIWAVITNTTGKTNVKDAIGSCLICPDVALVDPLLTVSLPPSLTASTGMDALTHAIEAYTSLPANPITDIYALAAITYITKYLPQAYAHGENLEARDYMMLGSLLAGIAFSNSDTAAVHSLAEAIGGLYDVPHGVANAIFLPYVMEYNLISNPKRYAQIAQAMGQEIEKLDVIEAANKSIEAVKKLSQIVEVPSLNSVGVNRNDFQRISEIALENLGTPDNPRKMTVAGFTEILTKAFRTS